MSFRPLYDHILIDRKVPAEKYGSIFIPDTAKEKTIEGTVVAIGKGISNHIHGGWHRPCVAVGDRVLFCAPSYSETEVESEMGKHLLLREDDIAAKVMSDGSLLPIHDKVFVTRKSEEERYGKIIIPDSAREKTQEGTVVAVGSGKILESGETIPLELQIGEKIIFSSKYAGVEIEFDGRKVLVLRQDDVAGVLEAEENDANP
jgi:chaperonin GroES